MERFRKRPSPSFVQSLRLPLVNDFSDSWPYKRAFQKKLRETGGEARTLTVQKLFKRLTYLLPFP